MPTASPGATTSPPLHAHPPLARLRRRLPPSQCRPGCSPANPIPPNRTEALQHRLRPPENSLRAHPRPPPCTPPPATSPTPKPLSSDPPSNWLSSCRPTHSKLKPLASHPRCPPLPAASRTLGPRPHHRAGIPSPLGRARSHLPADPDDATFSKPSPPPSATQPAKPSSKSATEWSRWPDSPPSPPILQIPEASPSGPTPPTSSPAAWACSA